jgi:transposase
LFKLGAVPGYHQTDNASAVTYQVRGQTGERAYNPGYVDLLNHFGLKARAIHIGCPDQNGDIKASNGSLKRALKQHLLLRGVASQ